MQQASEFFRPRWIGETVHPRTLAPNGVHLFGLVVDPAGFMVAGAFGAQSSRLAHFLPEVHLGISQTALIGTQRVTFRPAAAGSYDLFEFNHAERGGRLALLIDRTAMLTHPVENFEKHIRFFAIGSALTGRPYYSLWARRLSDLLSAAILPEWQERLWEEMAQLAWIAPCDNYGGFGRVWDVYGAPRGVYV